VTVAVDPFKEFGKRGGAVGPIATSAAEPSIIRPGDIFGPSQKKNSSIRQTILLVEDDENDVFFFERAMKLAGLSNPLRVAQDGRQAIDYLMGAGVYADRAEFPLPSLVLLDLKLPRVRGLDVLKWIRGQTQFQAIIVIVFTSSALASDIDKAYRLGANSYMVKPSDPLELREMLGVIKQYWLDLNVQPQDGMESAGHIESAVQGALVRVTEHGAGSA
jgi:CheY-like chemotaxis protein